MEREVQRGALSAGKPLLNPGLGSLVFAPALPQSRDRCPHRSVLAAFRTGVLLELVTDGAQQIVPVGHVALGLHPQGRLSIDDAHNA